MPKVKCSTSCASSVQAPQDAAAPQLASPDFQQPQTNVLERVHIHPVLYFLSASSSELEPRCPCSSCRSLQNRDVKSSSIYLMLSRTSWCCTEKKLYPLQTPREEKMWALTDLIIIIATNKTQLCYVSSVNKLDFFVVKRLILWGCPHLKLCFSSDSVFLCGGFIPIMKGTAQRGRVQNPYLLFNLKFYFKALINFWLSEKQKFSFLLPCHLLLPVSLQR